MDASSAKPKILFVEDDLTLSSLYTLRLQIEGFDVLNVSDGESALDQAKAFHPDLVLTDLMMPHFSGYEVIDTFKHSPEMSGIKIVVISALSKPDDIKKATDLGADDFIVKSQTPLEDVISKVRQHLGLLPKADA